MSYIVGKAKTACFDATKVVEGRKSLAALLGIVYGVMVAVAAAVAVAGATLAATACCWCGFICAAFVLYLAAVVATFGWASFQGFAFDVLALVFAAAAPLGEASVEGLLGMLAALGPLRVLVGAALGGALYLAVLSSHLYQRAGIGCARLRGAHVVSERRVFTCALALLAVGAASGWAPVLSWAAAVVDALAVVSTLRFCSGLCVVDALLIYLPLVCAAKTGGHHTRFVGTDGRASMLRLGCLAALVQPVASGSPKQLLPDVGAPYLIYSVFAVVMVACVVLRLYLRQVQSVGVVPSSQEALVDEQGSSSTQRFRTTRWKFVPTTARRSSTVRLRATRRRTSTLLEEEITPFGGSGGISAARKRRPIGHHRTYPQSLWREQSRITTTRTTISVQETLTVVISWRQNNRRHGRESSEDEGQSTTSRRVEIYWENDDLWYPGYIKCQRPVDGDPRPEVSTTSPTRCATTWPTNTRSTAPARRRQPLKATPSSGATTSKKARAAYQALCGVAW